jgi:signal transduction histidine kinase/HD-like signal output (HDOD) protein
MNTPARELFSKIETSRNLPSLPHVLVKLIEVCNKEQGTIKEISQIINKDASLSARLMRLVNSVYYGLPNRVTGIDHALLLLGTDAVKNIAISASVFHAFGETRDSSVFRLKLFWWHSFMCATLAKLIAEKTSYAAPDEAFLSGLLHDIGKLVLLGNFPKEYDEILQSHASRPDLLLAGETRLGATHCEVGAWMINRWDLQSFMADAVLYHHEPVHRILDALPLVKIIFVANALCSETVEGAGAKFKTAEEVFGFARSEVEELISIAEEEVKQVAESLDIEVEPPDAPGRAVLEKDAEKRQDLLRAVRDISLLQGTLQNLLEAHGEESILKVIRQGLQVLFDAHSTIFFLYDQERDVLVGKGDIGSVQDVLIKELVIPVEAGKCLAAKSLFQGIPLDSFGNLTKVDPTITDNQIIRLIGKDGMLCLPMVAHKQFVGVIVIGIDEAEVSDLSEEINLLTMFTNQAALALDSEHVRETQARLIQSERLAASSAVARKVAHEVNNPLGIIKNYLKILAHKLSKDSPVQEEISIINEEIDRVSAIVRELSDFSEPGVQKKGIVDINDLISDLIRIIHQSLLLRSDIKAHLDLEPSLPRLMTDKNRLKQVFINLVKNAVEAMPKGGNLYISTRRVPNGPGKKFEKGAERDQEYIEITISDDGSGIPDDIRSRLFEPFVSSKGERHAGLGLSIAYGIVKELNGTITYESDQTKGTSFKIVLPTESGQTH